jgi:adenine-specific DNA-methyltransferase
MIDWGGMSKSPCGCWIPIYDGRSLLPRQLFFPMAGETEGWAKVARNLNAEIDPESLKVLNIS